MRMLLTPDELCALEAQRQCGLLTFAQAIAYGLTINQIRQRLKSGRWQKVAPGVYRIAGVPASTRQAEWAAYLWAEGSGGLILGCAARIWGFRWFTSDPVQLAVPRIGNRRELPFTVHRYGGDSLIHTTMVDGLRVSTIPKTVMDLLGARDKRAVWVLARSLVDQSVTLAGYWFLYDDPEMKGHRGRRLLRDRLEAREARPPNEATGERKLWALMQNSQNLVLPQRQFWLTLPNGERVRYDFAYADLLFAIEVDDYGTHGPEDRFGSDRRRDSACALLGWFVLRIPEKDIDEHPDQVIATVKAHYDPLAK